ncbi:translation protein SH3-like domain-containing protein [Syncephalis fuscata]|nr:translation protein SH3-like domain-containing protein [Syncephalis fuscata]
MAAEPAAIESSPIIVPEKQFPIPKGPITNRNLIEVVTTEHLERLDPTGEKRALLSRRSRSHINPGDVLMIESYTSRTKGTTTRFMGVCIAICRKGVDTNVLVRNIVERIGVEFRFPVFSPMVKRIEILKRGEGYRRAKLYYLREQPGKAFQLAGLRKQQQQQQQQKQQAALAAKTKKA